MNNKKRSRNTDSNEDILRIINSLQQQEANDGRVFGGLIR
jgi:hypothetical protein